MFRYVKRTEPCAEVLKHCCDGHGKASLLVMSGRFQLPILPSIRVQVQGGDGGVDCVQESEWKVIYLYTISVPTSRRYLGICSPTHGRCVCKHTIEIGFIDLGDLHQANL